MTEGDVDFAQLVKQIRAAKRLTQEALARHLDVTFSTVNTWENGKHRPQRHLARQLLRLAEELGLTPIQQSAPDIGSGSRKGAKKRGRRKDDAHRRGD